MNLTWITLVIWGVINFHIYFFLGGGGLPHFWIFGWLCLCIFLKSYFCLLSSSFPACLRRKTGGKPNGVAKLTTSYICLIWLQFLNLIYFLGITYDGVIHFNLSDIIYCLVNLILLSDLKNETEGDKLWLVFAKKKNLPHIPPECSEYSFLLANEYLNILTLWIPDRMNI